MKPAAELVFVIRLLRKPLEYASSLDPGRLQVMPGLGGSLLSILDSHPGVREDFRDFRSLLTGFDECAAPKRMERVITLIRLLDRIERGAGDEGGEGDKARPGRRASARDRRLAGIIRNLETDAQYVKGVGPWMAEKLGRLGIKTVGDLLYHLPARYEDRRGLKKIRDAVVGEKATIYAEVMACGVSRRRGRRRIFNLLLSDGSGVVSAVWFNYSGDYLEKKFSKGQHVIASGVIKTYGKNLEMFHPDVELVEDEEDEQISTAGIVPVYPLTEGVFQKSMRRIARTALESHREEIVELLPAELLEKRELLPLPEALRLVHQPPEDAEVEKYNAHRSLAHRRLVYEEFFFLELGLALSRRGIMEEPAPVVAPVGGLAGKFRESLPFSFTRSQERVAAEILADMARPSPMHRLLQGDVGSGKTVVAVAAALAAIEGGFQAALMAPTEILSEQHYRTVSGMLSRLGVKPVLLTGAVRGRDREAILEGIEEGAVSLVLGTHALIQQKVKFKRLALAIIDEQHRFGVLQRARLKAKGPEGMSPHLLVMTATPIPRTLAMTVYGDLAVSVIREMPPGRGRIETRLFRERDRAKVYTAVHKEAGLGRQVFIVYPLVEESEKLELRDASSMSKHFRDEVFPDLKVGLVHGRMKAEEKEKVMRSFQRGGIDVLVATTVIEVGIDVPNATMMVVEHAERFGLSQLHQLRGRVGRSAHASQCLLVAGFARSEDAWKRLRIMEQTTDGFRIAEEDLSIRGPGEFFGTRQWGLPDFRAANIIRDADVLSEARDDAFAIVADDPGLTADDHRVLHTLLKQRWGKRFRLGTVG